jgi:hypothetical protein
MRRGRLAVPVAVVCAVTTAGSAAALPSGFRAEIAAKPPATVVKVIGPLDTNGHLAQGYRIRHRYSNASCESGSPTTGHAYQCFTPQSPNGIYDSCWVQSNPKYVVCLTKPWLPRKADRLHVTRGYGDSAGFLKVRKPWGVRLGLRTLCLRILGPVHTINGRSRTYDCNHRTFLAGPIRHHTATWRAHAYRRNHHGRYTSIGVLPVAVAWFGKPSHKD